jgi:transcriptional regulator with XRE-family HTH domain
MYYLLLKNQQTHTKEQAMEQVNFGEKIRTLREAKGISQRQLAMQLDITPTYMSKIERGEFQPPSEEVIKKMAKFLNYDSDLLLSLADKVDSELLKIIKGDPEKYCALLRKRV